MKHRLRLTSLFCPSSQAGDAVEPVPFRTRPPPPPPNRPSTRPASALEENTPQPEADSLIVWGVKDLATALEDRGTLSARLLTVGRLEEPDETAFRRAIDPVFAMTGSAPEAVEIAHGLVRLTQDEPNGPDLLYELVQAFMSILDPRQRPAVYLAFFAAHRRAILDAFGPARHPLIGMLEQYTGRLLDQQAVSDEQERPCSVQVEDVRSIHRAITDTRDGDKSLLNQRAFTLLLAAYTHTDAIADVQALLRTDGVRSNVDQWNTFRESLARCHAWTELVGSVGDQLARHAARSSATPALDAAQVGRLLRFTNEITDRPVDLWTNLQAVIPASIWSEAAGMMIVDDPASSQSASPTVSRLWPETQSRTTPIADKYLLHFLPPVIDTARLTLQTQGDAFYAVPGRGAKPTSSRSSTRATDPGLAV